MGRKQQRWLVANGIRMARSFRPNSLLAVRYWGEARGMAKMADDAAISMPEFSRILKLIDRRA